MTQGHLASLLLGQGTANSSRLFGTQVNRQSLALANLADQLGAALLAHNGEHAGDGLADGADGTRLGGILAARDGLNTESVQLVLQVGELLGELIVVLGTQFVGLDGRLKWCKYRVFRGKYSMEWYEDGGVDDVEWKMS